MNSIFRNILVWIVLGSLLIYVFDNIENSTAREQISYSQFKEEILSDRIAKVIFQGDQMTITGDRLDGSKFETVHPIFKKDDAVDRAIEENGIIAVYEKIEQPSIWSQLLVGAFPIILLLGIFFFFMRQMQGGMSGKGGPMSFGKSKAKLMEGGKVKTNFGDVAGCEEAKQDVQELVDFLRDPTKFQKLGGKIPRGVLMVGPPGTGKTLLARAVAGEAKVPFFTISGSDFVEMFVGVGASRVRDMFEQAKKQAPCIVFIDEIDAVGRHRGTGMGGGHDEREQTLNQLLVEMDGFEGNDGVIVIAATNRPDVLDPALLRPGRFDRQVVVDLPDIRGREAILKVHMRKVPLDSGVDPLVIARGTPGFSGADLANLINEAALFAARYSDKKIDQSHLDLAKDKIMMGAERKSMILSEEQKRITAYHEAGHAIVGRLCPTHDPVYKVTIIPRGRALGVTMFLPEEDTYMQSKEYLLGRIATLFGGRIAESIINGSQGITTGASNDIEVATGIATNMVTKWGLSEALGTIKYGEDEGSPFLGRSAASPSQTRSEETSKLIDSEIRLIIDSCYRRAENLLKENLDKLNVMADALLKYETIDAPQIEDIMAGAQPREPKGWSDDEPKSNTKKKTSIKGTAEEL
ncbi:ATP-dependent zinc metalloprotease FtsH [Gammaproteobacteria bacterium]|nr:ATP-dependent zinc metalloprotease FtsH [Gammaproteobacteria bacterium]MDA7697107.1 ATP-dependent zinc metalloprotease FtsH [Gammaproteobacteria bacterium]MDA7734997.1 ATP-dependent zinc metalloprotease FtsH [Gammaproteobacteria bacterium]MDA7800155.1 ATP-dependent zinc metalloprotease FtsH [Gammaproteobacteria bacterium]MDA7821352.1 ATP-dependent zinc metalloprotease FtsH [Gammaproteobacteria bacterium]